MGTLNASTLVNQNLGALALTSQEQATKEQEKLFSKLGQAGVDVNNAFIQEDIDQAMQKNFDPATGKLNEQGVMSELFQKRPKQAMALQDRFQKSRIEDDKSKADTMYKTAQANHLNSQMGSEKYKAQKDMFETEQKQIVQLHNMLSAIPDNDPAGTEKFNNIVQMAKQRGWAGTELVEGKTWGPETKAYAKNIAIGALDDVKNKIEMMKAEASQTTAGAAVQNANTNVYKAESDDQNKKADIMKDMRGQDIIAQTAANTLSASQNQKQELTPGERLSQEKENRKLGIDSIEKVKAIDDQVKGVEKRAAMLTNFNAALDRMMKSPVLKSNAWYNIGTSKIDPNSEAAKFAADASIVLGGTMFNIISESKKDGGGIGSQISNKDMESAAGAAGLPGDANLFRQDPVALTNTLRSLKDINQKIIDATPAEKERLMKDADKMKSLSEPIDIKSKKQDNSSTPSMFKASNGITLTPQQIADMRAKRAAGQL